MSSDPTPPAAPAQPSPERKPEMKSMFQSSLADSLGLTVTQKPATAAKPQTPPKPEKPEKQSSFFAQDGAPSLIAPNMTVRGIEPDLPKANPRTRVIEGDGLRAKQGIDMPRLPVSFRPREGWADVAGRNIGKESGFRNTRMAAHEMEAGQVKAWADYNRKQLEERKRGGAPG